MTLRTGVDLIEISRIQEVIARHGKRYLERIYTPAELAQFGRESESLAGRFAESCREQVGGDHPREVVQAVEVTDDSRQRGSDDRLVQGGEQHPRHEAEIDHLDLAVRESDMARRLRHRRGRIAVRSHPLVPAVVFGVAVDVGSLT